MDWLNQQNMDTLAFIMLSAATLGSALAVVTLRNLFHCALFLAACLVSVGGIFLLLGAEFLFAIQLLIYAGGVVVLILFAIMLTREIWKDEAHQTPLERGLTVLVAGATFIGLVWVAVTGSFPEYVKPAAETQNATVTIAESLLTYYLVPFEVVSVLLLVAMIGAILIGKPEQPPSDGGEE